MNKVQKALGLNGIDVSTLYWAFEEVCRQILNKILVHLAQGHLLSELIDCVDEEILNQMAP